MLEGTILENEAGVLLQEVEAWAEKSRTDLTAFLHEHDEKLQHLRGLPLRDSTLFLETVVVVPNAKRRSERRARRFVYSAMRQRRCIKVYEAYVVNAMSNVPC